MGNNNERVPEEEPLDPQNNEVEEQKREVVMASVNIKQKSLKFVLFLAYITN